MAKQTWKFARTSNMVRVFIQDSSVTTGAGLTGVDYSTSGLVIDLIANNSNTAYHYKSAATATIENITTPGTFAAPSASNCRFKAVDGTNFPGLYEIQFLDGLFDDASCTSVIGRVAGVTNMVPTFFEIQLVAYDPDDAAGLGLSRVDAAVTTRLAPTTAGRTLDVSATGEAGIDWANIGSPTTAVNLSGTNVGVDQVVASVSGAVGSVTGAVGSVTGAVGSVTGAVGSVTGAVGSVTGNVGGSVASVSGAVGSVTGNVGGNVTGSVGSVAGAVGSVTGNVGGNVVGSVGSVASYGTLVSDVATAVWAAGTRTLSSFGSLVSDIWTSFNATQIAKFFSVDSGTTYASAVAGSVVKEIADNASGGGGGGGASQYLLEGTFFRSGSTYYWIGHLRVNGSVVTSGLSSLAVVDVRGNNGATDLGYTAGTAATIGTNGTLYGSFTLTTAPTDGQPCALTVTVVYGGTTYRGRFLAAGVP